MGGPLTKMGNTGGRAVLGDDMLTSKYVNTEMPGGCPSGNVCPRGKSFPTAVPQEEVTDVLHVFLALTAARTSSEKTAVLVKCVAMKILSFFLCATIGKRLESINV